MPAPLAAVALVALVALAAPVVARIGTRGRVPAIVVEIVAGVALGPAGAHLVGPTPALDTLALLGVTFLFFLAGLEVDLHRVRGRLLGRALLSWVAGLAIALVAAVAVGEVAAVLGGGLGAASAPLLVAVALSATGLGLVVPVLAGAHLLERPVGQVVVVVAGVAEFTAVTVLALVAGTGNAGVLLLFLGLLVALAVAVTLAGRRLGAVTALTRLVDRLSGGSAQLRVRFAVALVVGFSALAQAAGLEVVLGAFLAGGVLSVLDRSGMADPALRDRLDGIGYGFLVPVFFVVSGARLDFSALAAHPGALVLVPLLLLALLLARGGPAWLLHRDLGPAARAGAGLLYATSLPFLVTAAQIGVAAGTLSSATAAALTLAGLLAVCVFPAVGVALLERTSREEWAGSRLTHTA